MRPAGFCEILYLVLNAPTSDRSLGSDVYIYRHKQNMIAIVAVRPNVLLGRQYLFCPQIKPFIFIFWENMTYCSKK
jgi:hypothetical protein